MSAIKLSGSAGGIVATNSLVPSSVKVGGGSWMSANTVLPQSPEVLSISYPFLEIVDPDKRKLVTFWSDGKIELAERIEPDEAAKHFWRAVRTLNPFVNEVRIYKSYIRELERENNELKARIAGETVVGSHLDDDGEGTG